MFEQGYSVTQIKGDLAFLKYAIKKNQVQLRPNTGLQKLINGCEHFLSISEITDEDIKPINVLYLLVNSLKSLWIADVEFSIQLRAMNTGEYEYGKPDANMFHFFKDFEFEIFSASQLIKNNVAVELPQDTAGEDLQYLEIDIQCKHPNTTNQIGQNILDFNSRLNQAKRYGVFGLGTDDCLNYSERLVFEDEEDFNNYMSNKIEESETILKNIFSEKLSNTTRILGFYTTSTYFILFNRVGLRLIRMSNSAFCFRPDRKEIQDRHYKQTYKIISTFNPQPTWLTFEKRVLQSISS